MGTYEQYGKSMDEGRLDLVKTVQRRALLTWSEDMVCHLIESKSDNKVELRNGLSKVIKVLVPYGMSVESLPKAIKERVQNALKFK